jgi:hypothetical protein
MLFRQRLPLSAAQPPFEYGRESITTQDTHTSPQENKVISGLIALKSASKTTSRKLSTTQAWFLRTMMATSHFSR